MKTCLIFICLMITTLSVKILSTQENYIDKILESFNDSPKKELFKVYHFLYEKKYDLNSEEGVKRYKIFKENMKRYKEHNSKDSNYILGIDSFADLTQEEFENFFSTPSNKIKSPNRTVLTRTDIALNVNRLVGQVCADNGQTLFHCEKSGDTHNKGLNESGGSVLRRHICARWKFSSPNEV